MSKELSKVMEAVLFVSDEPLSLDDFKDVFERPAFQSFAAEEEAILTALDGIKEKYAAEEYVFELRELAGGYQLLTKPQWGDFAKQAVQAKDKKRLSRAAIETLAVIAYKQPVTRTELEHVRGVSCDYAINKLIDKELIEAAGRADLPGKPLLYKTTPQFLAYFGIQDVSELPALKEITNENEETDKEFQNPELRAEAANGRTHTA